MNDGLQYRRSVGEVINAVLQRHERARIHGHRIVA